MSLVFAVGSVEATMSLVVIPSSLDLSEADIKPFAEAVATAVVVAFTPGYPCHLFDLSDS